jgi:hypothetical protein
MISKKHFLEQMKKLMIICDEQVSDERVKAYYNVLSPDFTNEQFDKALNLALKNSFKFPPIAAFYHRDPLADVLQSVYSPVTEIEGKRIRWALERAENDAK